VAAAAAAAAQAATITAVVSSKGKGRPKLQQQRVLQQQQQQQHNHPSLKLNAACCCWKKVAWHTLKRCNMLQQASTCFNMLQYASVIGNSSCCCCTVQVYLDAAASLVLLVELHFGCLDQLLYYWVLVKPAASTQDNELSLAEGRGADGVDAMS
jgi:hypothetical protein